jgi:Putative zinc-finger
MTLGEHVSDDRLEEYCLGTVPAAELEDFENHLLICEECRRRQHEADLYVRTMRRAMETLAAEPRVPGSRASRLVAMLRPAPVAACAAIAALALICTVPFLRNVRTAEPVAVTLESMRGGPDNLRVHAPERTPLSLTLDLTGVEQVSSYQVRIVDATGNPVMESAAHPAGGQLVLHAPARLRRGTYWVRVYDRPESRTPLREYGLELD